MSERIRHGRRAITRDEADRVITSLEGAAAMRGLSWRDRRILYAVALATGLSANDIREIRVRDFDTASGRLQVASQDRTCALPQPARRYVEQCAHGRARSERLLPESGWSAQQSKYLNADLARAGVEKATKAGFIDFKSFQVAYFEALGEGGA